jgi:4'-phosphopantetheinyl transferase EntD
MTPRRSGPERIETPHGTLVLLELPDGEALAAALAALPALERAHAEQLGEVRRREFVTGRAALHAAIGDRVAPILPDGRGAPLLPAGWAGSISHKGALAAALAAPAAGGWVGVDVERAAPPRVDIARRILTPREQARLAEPADRDADARGRAVTLRFSIKEAIYKAIAPCLQRYVGFTEVEVELDGEACTVAHALPFAIEAAWREHAGHWLATARARPDPRRA